MRLNARVAEAMPSNDGFREAVLTTPVCGGATCHIGSSRVHERTIDGMLFLNQVADPTHWNDGRARRACSPSGTTSRPDGVEADPAYLGALCRHALARRRRDARARVRHAHLRADHARRVARDEGGAAVDARSTQLYGATESRRAVHGVHRTGGCTTTRATRTSSSSTPAAGSSRVRRHDARPHLDAAFALRHRRLGARRRRLPLRPCPTRATRSSASKGASTTAIDHAREACHARRCSTTSSTAPTRRLTQLAAARRVAATAARILHVVASDGAQRGRRGRATSSVRPVEPRRPPRSCPKRAGNIVWSARCRKSEAMANKYKADFPAPLARARRHAHHLPRLRLDHAQAARR